MPGVRDRQSTADRALSGAAAERARQPGDVFPPGWALDPLARADATAALTDVLPAGT
ncbi:MAG TPA: hypothetical protein VGA04_16040 [Streptosporangiaceae bacterium]